MSPEALSARVGTELGMSDWLTIDQRMVDTFAALTQDTYFIHTDPVRASATQFGGTIAHGFLTMSMMSVMAYQVCPAVEGTKTQVNYGFNRLRFISPVRTGSRIRGRFGLKSFERKQGRWQVIYDVTVEIEDGARPALQAEWIGAGFF